MAGGRSRRIRLRATQPYSDSIGGKPAKCEQPQHGEPWANCFTNRINIELTSRIAHYGPLNPGKLSQPLFLRSRSGGNIRLLSPANSQVMLDAKSQLRGRVMMIFHDLSLKLFAAYPTNTWKSTLSPVLCGVGRPPTSKCLLASADAT